MGDDIQRKSIKDVIPKIYKRQFLEACLFGWIRSAKTFIPTITTEQAIQAFYKDQDITEEDYPVSSARTDYNRMTREYYASQKTDNEEEEQ